MWDRVQATFDRIAGYNPVQVAVELFIIGVVAFVIVRFVQGTRAAGALKGLLLLLIVAFFFRLTGGGAGGAGGNFQRLAVLYDRFLALVAVGLIIIFQPELRRALVRLGETPFLRTNPKDVQMIVDEIAEACRYFSKARFGAIMVLERGVGLAGIVEGGTRMNAELSSRLLQTIFFPGSALHDLAVVIKGKQVHSAGVQLPLAEPSDMPEPLGSRHRAAVGLTKECDAIAVVVSEETGGIRLAERGRLSAPLSIEQLRDELVARLAKSLKNASKSNGPTPAEIAGNEPAGDVGADGLDASLTGLDGTPSTGLAEGSDASDDAQRRLSDDEDSTRSTRAVG
jgi:diadenylate cyclase